MGLAGIFFLTGMILHAGQGWGQRVPVYTMSTGSGAGGGSFAKVQSDATIVVTLWIVAGEERKTKGDSPSSGVGRSGVGAGAGGWRAGSNALTQGICVRRIGCCRVLLALIGSLGGLLFEPIE